MSDFLCKLFAKDEHGVDSVSFMSVMAIFGLIAAAGYLLVIDPAKFSLWDYAAAAVGIITGGNSAGKLVRDKWSQPPGVAAAPQA